MDGSGLEVRIDALDRRLIEALQENGRESFRHIAGRLDVSEGTIRARYRRLAAMTVVQVTAIANPLVLGFDAMAMVGVRTSLSPKLVVDSISELPEASYIVITSGRFDLLVELVCVDRSHLLEVTTRLRETEGVASTETFVYLELSKQLYDWGVHLDEGADTDQTVTATAAAKDSNPTGPEKPHA